MIRRLLHRLAERFGLAICTAETWWDGNRLMAGFRCSCGSLMDIHEATPKEAANLAMRLLLTPTGPFPWGEFPADDG